LATTSIVNLRVKIAHIYVAFVTNRRPDILVFEGMYVPALSTYWTLPNTKHLAIVKNLNPIVHFEILLVRIFIFAPTHIIIQILKLFVKCSRKHPIENASESFKEAHFLLSMGGE